jgi:flagellar hook assembly protein FlgD
LAIDEFGIPTEFSVYQNYPNPFNPSTTINFDLPVDNHVQLQVYDLQGRLVQELSNSILKAGYHQFIWNADRYASGAYIIKLTAGDFITTQKITLIK